MKTNGLIAGHAAMLSANVIWGLMSPVGKDALNSPDILPISLIGVRIIGAALLFWIASFVLPQSIAPKEKVERKDYIHLVVASLFIISANQMCCIFGMSLTSPVDATVMCSTCPFFTLIFAWLLWHEKHGWVKIAGVVVGFIGMLVFILGGKTDVAMNVTNPLLGNIICIMSQVFGAIYMVRYAFLSNKYSAFTLMKWLFTISAVLMLFVAGPSIMSTPWSSLSTQVLIEVGYVVLFGTFVAYLLLPVGQRHLKPTSIAMYNYLQPIVAAVFSVVAGLATITISTVVGSAFVFLGVWMVNRKAVSDL